MISEAQLSLKKKRLLAQSLADFDPRWDEGAGLLHGEDGGTGHVTRASVFYALALLIRQGPGDADRADRILRAVLSLQRLNPGQLWHGTFASLQEQPCPVPAPFDMGEMTALAHWEGDVLWEKLTTAFAARLRKDPELAGRTPELSGILAASLRDVWPTVWETYDPNWREFIFATMALILEEFDALLPAETVSAAERAAREGLKGARFRAESGLTPLNTNVEVMHVFIFDAFARRFRDPELAEYAADYARRFTEDYLAHHAVAEFNSPTYNGVVLSYTNLLWSRGGSEAVRRMGEVLETGLWEDFADFYNPALGALCGPFTRAYGLRIDGTALPMLMYLGMDEIPEDRAPAFGPETESACILCCGEPRIPEHVRRALTASRGERRPERSFRELAERGKPGDNRSLCTATAWITDDLMIGGMRGSTNTSHQLHAGTVHWRNSQGGVSGMKLLRRSGEGQLIHLRTVYLDMKAEPGLLEGEIRNETNGTVLCDFEVESPGAARGAYAEDCWQVDGLRCGVRLTRVRPGQPDLPVAAVPAAEREDLVRLTAPLGPGETMRVRLEPAL